MEENKASAAACDVSCQAGTSRPGGASGDPSQAAGLVLGPAFRFRKHPSEPAFRGESMGTGLEGRGLADPVRFPLTWPLPPPRPGWASSNKMFSLGLEGLMGWVTGASLSRLPRLRLLKAGLDAPSLQPGQPTCQNWVSEVKWPLKGRSWALSPEGGCGWNLPRWSFLRGWK